MKQLIIALSLFTLGSCASQSTENENKTTETVVQTSNNNTITVDVRSVEEWNQDGHADCTVNYPMDQIASKMDELKKYDEVILVCRSGGRAGAVKSQLEDAGFKNVKNLGAWQNVKCE
jgi:rhodanese-related sulfurtransferase